MLNIITVDSGIKGRADRWAPKRAGCESPAGLYEGSRAAPLGYMLMQLHCRSTRNIFLCLHLPRALKSPSESFVLPKDALTADSGTKRRYKHLQMSKKHLTSSRPSRRQGRGCRGECSVCAHLCLLLQVYGQSTLLVCQCTDSVFHPFSSVVVIFSQLCVPEMQA